MNDFLQGRKVYNPMNGFAAPSQGDDSTALLPRFPKPAPTHPRSTTPMSATVQNNDVQHCGGSGKPEIELIQTDGRIEQIVVTCGCGERITLHCSY